MGFPLSEIMNPILTTITSVWQRPEMLRLWLQHLKGAAHPEVCHLVYFVGEDPPAWWEEESGNCIKVVDDIAPGKSIGYYHNMGAIHTDTEWIMKLDVDTFPNVHYFNELVPVLLSAGSKEWFNGGMFYLGKVHSRFLHNLPLGDGCYRQIMDNRRTYSANSYILPAATNFICRRREYLLLGGCDSRFKGYGWEDYQQIYMLEKYQRGEDPLPGPVTLDNVTQRCRDEISRPKAKQLWERNPWLCLLHHWHPANKGTSMNDNRQALYDYVKGVQ